MNIPFINCPVCLLPMKLIIFSDKQENITYKCAQKCFNFNGFYLAPYVNFKKDLILSELFQYSVPFIHNDNILILKGIQICSYGFDKTYSGYYDNKTIISKINFELDDEILISIPYVPINLYDTKQSSQYLFSKLLKLIPFI